MSTLRARRFLGKEGRAKVEALIAAAEARSKGEMVVCIASRSVDSTRAEALAAFFTGIAAVAITWILAQKVHFSAAGAALALGLPAVLGLFAGGAVLGFALVHVAPTFGVWFTTKAQRRDAVERRARTAFYDLGIHDTRAKTGILVFVSVLEKQATVVADAAVRTQLPEERWSHLEDIVAGAFARKQAVDGLLRAVEYAGELLEEYLGGAPDSGENAGDGELRNEVRFL